MRLGIALGILAILIAALGALSAVPAARAALNGHGGTCGDGFCDYDASEDLWCSDDCGDLCGNGVCNNNEDQSSCPGDCGSPPPAGCQLQCNTPRPARCVNGPNAPAGTNLLIYEDPQGTPNADCTRCEYTEKIKFCDVTTTACSQDGKGIGTTRTAACAYDADGDAQCAETTQRTACPSEQCETAAGGTAQCKPPAVQPPDNRAPVLNSIALSRNIAKSGSAVKITSSASDADTADLLTLQCGNTAGSSDTSFSDDYGCQSEPAKTNPECTIAAPQGEGDKTIFCRAYDGKKFSAAKSARLTVDNTKPSTIITEPPGLMTRDFPVAITDTDNNGPGNLDKCFYRIESGGQDTTFRDTDTVLTVRADNSDNIEFADTQCRDISYRFIIDRGPPDTAISIFFTANDHESQKMQGTATEPRKISRCDGTSTESFADGHGWFITSFRTDSNGKGEGTVVSSASSTHHAAYLFEAYSGALRAGDNAAPIAKDTIYVWDKMPNSAGAIKPQPQFWTGRQCSAPTPNVKVGKQCASQGGCTVFARARDRAGNTGDPDSESFTVSFVFTQITAPAADSVQSANFKVAVRDEDLSGAGFDKCFYNVQSGTETTIGANGGAERPCGSPNPAEVNIPVKLDGCKHAGSCTIRAWARNKNNVVGNQAVLNVKVDFDKPTTTIAAPGAAWKKKPEFTAQITDTDNNPASAGALKCEYKVISGGVDPKVWTGRPCNKELPVAIDEQRGPCKSEGAGACVVVARSQKCPGASSASSSCPSPAVSDEARQGFNILLTSVTNENLALTAAASDVGLRFTFPRSPASIPVYIVCNAASQISACRAEFAKGTSACGLNKPCLCGSLTGNTCELACSEQDVEYYGIITASGSLAAVSQPGKQRCPQTAAGDIEKLIADFELVDIAVTDGINRNQAVCQQGIEEFCRIWRALLKVQPAVRSHIEWLKSVRAAPTSENVREAKRRSDALWKQVQDAFAGTSGRASIQLRVQDPVKVNEETLNTALISKTGGKLYGKVTCEVMAGGKKKPGFTSACAELASTVWPDLPNEPPPIGATGRATAQALAKARLSITGLQTAGQGATMDRFEFRYRADEVARWTVSCKLLISFVENCPYLIEEDSKSASFDVVRELKSVIQDVSVPITVARNIASQVKVRAKNPDAARVHALATCFARLPGSSSDTELKTQCTALEAGEEKELGAGLLATRTGTGTVNRCTLSVSATDQSCRTAAAHDTKTVQKNFEVVDPTTMIITRVDLPLEPPVNRETAITASVFNPIDDRYVSVECSARRPDNSVQTLASDCIFTNKGDEKSIRIAFTPAAKGRWSVTSCTLSSSTDVCATKTAQHTLQNIGSFDVTGGRKILIEGVTPPGNQKAGAETNTAVALKNPTDNTRFGRAVCTFLKPDNNIELNVSDCTEMPAGEPRTVSVKMDVNLPGTWKLQNCKAESSTDRCRTTALDDTKTLDARFEVRAAGRLSFGQFEPLQDIQTGQTSDVRASVLNGDDQLFFGKMECSFRNTANQVVRNSSLCTRVDANGNAQLAASIFGASATTWNVEQCRLSASRNLDCSSAGVHDTKTTIGTIRVTDRPPEPQPSIVSVQPPVTAVQNSEATIAVIAENKGGTKQGTATCKFSHEGGTQAEKSSACVQMPGNGEKTTLEVKRIFDTRGKWTVISCSINAAAACAGAPRVHELQVNKAFDVTAPDRTIITRVQLPVEPVVNRQTSITVSAFNSAGDRFMNVVCSTDTPNAGTPGGATELASDCEFVLRGADHGIRIPFTPDRKGSWDVRSCALFSSSDFCRTVREEHKLQNAGSFAVVGGRKLAFRDVVPPGDQKAGTMTQTHVTIDNPTDNTRFGKAVCTFLTPVNRQETNASECVEVPSDSSRTAVIRMHVNVPQTWTLQKCEILGSVDVCRTTALDDTRAVDAKFNVAAPGKLSFGQFEPLQDIQTGQTSDVRASVLNGDDQLFFGKMECSFRNTANQVVRNSSLCTRVDANGNAQLAASIFGASATTWTVEECTLAASRNLDCSRPAQHDRKTGVGTIRVTDRPPEPQPSIVSVQPPVTVFINSAAETDVIAENNGGTKHGIATCIFEEPPPGRARSGRSSACVQLPGNGARTTMTLSRTFGIAGTWRLVSCSLNASTSPTCANAPKVSEVQVDQAFEAARPNNLFITGKELPTTVIRGELAQVNITVENPLADNRFVLVTCTLDTPGGQKTASNCTGIASKTQKKAGINALTDSFGTWTLSRCSVRSSFTSQCASPQDQEQRSGLGSFEVVRGTKLTATNFIVAPPEIRFGEQVVVSASISNPSLTEMAAQMTCDFITPQNRRETNSSPCVQIGGEGSASARVFMTGSVPGNWRDISCAVKGGFDCSSLDVHFRKDRTGEFLVTAGPVTDKNLRIVSARPAGNVLRGEFAKAEVVASSPVENKFAVAECSFRTQSGQAKTGSSQCAEIAAGRQRTLLAEVRADELGTWTITSCTLKASANQDCSQAAVNDSRSNIGTFSVAAPGNLIIAQISAGDVANGSRQDIAVTVENPLAEARFGRVACTLRKPSGATAANTSACARIEPGLARDFIVSQLINQVGTWTVASCSVSQATRADCSDGAAVHTATGGTFVSSRPDKILFTTELIFPASVQNGSTITVRSAARNPTNVDIFARMRCVFVQPGGSGAAVANSSCFLLPAETTLPVSVSTLVNRVGQWQIASCSMLGAGDSSCSDEAVQTTNSTGGAFVSTGVQTNNLSIVSKALTSTIVRGSEANISLGIGNPNDFPQFTTMVCSVRNPTGSEENLSSACSPVAARGVQQLHVSRIANDIGIWNATSCRVFASAVATCAGALLQNSTGIGTFNVTLPTRLIIRSASGHAAVNDSLTNITVIAENPLAESRFALIACSVRAPSGRNVTNSSCSGMTAGEVRHINFSLFADEVGTWSITRCGINASQRFDCSQSQSHSNTTGGTFSVVKGTNLSFANARLLQQRVFIGAAVDLETSVRNPSETDLFGKVTCTMRAGSAQKQNTSACTLFRGGAATQVNIGIAADTLGTWDQASCSVSGTLDSGCGQTQAHDTINIAGAVNVTTVPDIFVTAVDVPEGINRNTTGIATVRVRNDGLQIFANATCNVRSPTRTFTNSSGCQRIDPGTADVHVPFFVDRLGNWSVFNCSVSGAVNRTDSTCGQVRLHNVSNITRQFNGTGRILEITEVIRPEGDIRVGQTAEVPVRVKNIDNVLHKGFVNCTLRQPDNRTREIKSPTQTIPVDETVLFKPSFVAELAGTWRLRSCIVYRTESPAFKEDEEFVDEIFTVSVRERPPPPPACSINTDCPGTDLRCFCSGGECRACPVGTACRSHRCESIVQPQCAFDSDCPAGYQCKTGTCVQAPQPQCTFDTDCLPSQQCSSGVCAEKPPQCLNDGQCLPGYKCVSRLCEKQEQPGQNIVMLIIIVLAAIIIIVLLFVAIMRRRIARHDIFAELEEKK